jgi:hypothetical protein
MARFHGPQIVKSGLQIYYDAANPKSYPGSGTILQDISGNGNYATLYNGVAISSANSGCFVFDGTDDYVFMETNGMPIDAYTKTVWFYITDFTNNNNLMSGDNDSRHALWLDASTNLKAGHNGGDGYRSVVSTTTLELNKWYFGAVTWENSIEFNLYVNGKFESSNTFATDPYIGDSRLLYLGSFGGANLLEGRIALASVYDRALSAEEILQNFNVHRSRFGV